MGKKKTSRRSQLDPKVIQWHDESIPAALFLKSFDLPRVVKLNSGNYGNFGCGTEVNVSQPFLLHTARHCTKVLAESLVFDKSRASYVDTGNQIVIPTNYPGWFSYSREDQHRFQAWTCVRDIAFHHTKRIVSCHPITCYVQAGRNANGERVYAKKVCPAGEIFALGDRYVERTTRRQAACCFCWIKGEKRTRESVEEVDYVLAKDSANVDLLIPMSAKGMFCKVGRVLSDGRIESQAVYRMNDLLDVVDLPCCVELVYGKSPSKAHQFTGMLRLEDSYTEETVIACSLGSSHFTLLEFPIDSEIEFIPTKNNQQLLNNPFIESAVEFCLEEVLPYIISLKVIQNFFSGKQPPSETTRESSVQKEPVPPPLPLLGPESDGSVDGYNADDHFSDEFTDDETAKSQDAHYETIPFDKARGIVGSPMTEQSLIHNTFTEHGNNETECEYLIPVSNNTQAVYSNVNRTDKKPKRNPSNVSSQQKFGAVCPANSIIHGADEFIINDSLINRESAVLQRLPPVGRERMDKFLQDSLEELNRVRLSGEISPNPPMMAPIKSPPVVPPKPPQPEIQEKLDAFLDEIFDCDSLEKGQIAPKVTNGPPDKKQSTPNLNQKEMDEKPPLVRSLSDIHLQNGTSLSLYVPSVLSEHNGGRTRARSSFDAENERDANNDSGSSSRSVSDIYKQMKYSHYQRSGSNEYPYPRADSGIFVSPRCTPSERDSKHIYRAMSEMSWKPPDDVAALSVEEVALSLVYIGLKPDSANLFCEQQIDGEQLLGIDDTLLREGFPELNGLERKKVLDFIKGWRPKKLLV